MGTMRSNTSRLEFTIEILEAIMPSLSCIGYRLERLSGRAVGWTSGRALW